MDFPDTFALNRLAANVNIVAAVVGFENSLLRHIDMKQMFAQAHLDEAVYMPLTDDLGDMRSEVIILQRAMYGVQQTGKE